MRQNKLKNIIKRCTGTLMSLSLCINLMSPVIAFAQTDNSSAIHIKTQEDLEELAENCRLDTWSQGKTIILDNDLVLDDTADEFLPIPIFGGTFEGNGHTISGLSLDGENSRIGLFDTVQAGGAIKSLSVVGQVSSGGDGDTVGGLAGINYGKLISCSFDGTVQGKVSVGGLVGINESTGQIVNCRFQGSVTGEHYVGGIAGQNTGSLVRCENHGEINTTAVEVSVDISDISMLRTTESVPAGTDIGGIAGFSSGVIQNCENQGSVGYEHMGYNVGGIVGRQSGYLDGCKNVGTINGRKDVGGIAGQLEPQVTLRYSEDLLDKLFSELDTLQRVASQATSNARISSNDISERINSLISDIGNAKDAVNGLSGAITDWGNDNIEEINDITARISWVIGEAEPIFDKISDTSEILEDASSLMSQAAESMAGAGEQGEEAAEDFERASENLHNAADHVKNCKSHIRSAIDIAKEIVTGSHVDNPIQSIGNELKSAVEEVQRAKDSLKKAVDYAGDAKSDLGDMGEQGIESLDILTEAMDGLNDGMSSMGSISDDISSIVSTLAEEPAVSFTPIDSSVTSKGDDLDAALSQVLNSTSGLQESVSASSDRLFGDFDAVNGQLGVITDLLHQQIEEDKEKDTSDSLKDISDEDSEEAVSGKINESVNSGNVFGDINVAGIVGSMSVEYDFDPEDDLTKEGTRSLNFQYKMLAVTAGCTNEGSISAKKDYAGGIVGRMDLGAVKSCESYGDVESSSGNYIGGVAGLTRSVIRNCFVKCTLSGDDYIGGAAGASDNSSEVSNCYTMVDIEDSGRYHGAVCGTEEGEFIGNYYVSDTLAGLGRISYAGKAEPLSFETFAQIEGLPKKMTQFTLRFVVEDEEIKSQTFSYGESFGEDVFPEIPVKDGYYASWDTDDLTNLHFDKTVTAEYERYVLNIPSQAARESGRPIFLMDGDFSDKVYFTASSIDETERIHGKKAEEQWRLYCSDTSQESYTVRYLSPEETAEGYRIYVKQDGRWKKADTTAFGSYLVFSVPSAESEVAIVPAINTGILIVLGLLLISIILILLIRKLRRKKIRVSVEQEDEKSIPEAVSDENAVEKKKKRLITIAAAVVAAIIAIGIYAAMKMGVFVNAYELLNEFSNRTESAMTLSLNTEMDGRLTQADIDINKTQVDGHSVTSIQNNGISLYYADGAVIMENGKAYRVSELYPDYSNLTEEAAKLFQTLSFTTRRSGGVVTCSLTAEGENARRLLKILVPEQIENLSDTQKLKVELSIADDEIQKLCFYSEGTLMDDSKTPYTISAELKPAETDETFTLPEPVIETVSSGEIESETVISDGLFRLLSAWTNLSQEKTFTADISMGVECSPISLNENIKFERTIIDGEKIGCIRKKELAVYFADGNFCDQNGAVIDAKDNALADRKRLIEALYQICMNGEFKCTDTGNDTWLYTLTLDEDAMKSVAYAAAPEMEKLPVTLTAGSVQIMIKGSNITEIDFSCTGGLNALADTAPVTVSVRMGFTHNSGTEVPNAVKNQLIQERTEENG